MAQLPMEKEWYKPENMVELELVFEKEMKSVVEEWFVEEVKEDADGRLSVHTFRSVDTE